MPVPKHPLSRLHHLHLQLFGFLPPPLITVRQRQVGHAGQRVWMLVPKNALFRLYHLYKQLFSLLPLTLILIRRRQISHAGWNSIRYSMLQVHSQLRLLAFASLAVLQRYLLSLLSFREFFFHISKEI